MATKQLMVDGIGQVILSKRKGARNIRISLVSNGSIRVSMPTWLPYKAALGFIETKRPWIIENHRPKKYLVDGQRVGKHHTLLFIKDPTVQKATTRVSNNKISVYMSVNDSQSDAAVQETAENAVIRALKKESQNLLTQRLDDISHKTGLSYRSVKIKKMKSRWGSCTNKKDIVLNAYLIQLPWHLIDYVILHELTHTKVLSHGKPFWEEMLKHAANAKELRKEIKLYQAEII